MLKGKCLGSISHLLNSERADVDYNNKTGAALRQSGRRKTKTTC